MGTPVRCICGCRMNVYQDFIVLGDRFFYLFELKNIRWSVFCVYNCFHEFPPRLRGNLVGCSAMSGYVILLHSDDYMTLFVSCFYIPVSLDNLFQRIASINDRLYLSRLNKLFEEN